MLHFNNGLIQSNPKGKKMTLPAPKGQRFEHVMLRPDDLEGETGTFLIERIGEPPETLSTYSDIAVFGTLNGVKYVLPMDTAKQNYLLLHERFGDDEKNWVGKSFRIRSRYSKANETDFIAVVPEAGKPAKRRG
jgi:hypothetical protein